MTRPTTRKDAVALKIEVSAPIADTRISAVLGEDVSIWSVSAVNRHNDCLKAPSTLRQFRECVRKVLAEIKDAHGEHSLINVFPAMPVAMAVEFGRVWMPKADLPLRIYDQNRSAGGFIRTIDIRAEGV